MADAYDNDGYAGLPVETGWAGFVVEPGLDRSSLRGIEPAKPDARLIALTDLSSVAIETCLVAHLSGTLHSVFDAVADRPLPIYFGPLLGRLYLEGP